MSCIQTNEIQHIWPLLHLNQDGLEVQGIQGYYHFGCIVVPCKEYNFEIWKGEVDKNN